MNVIAQQSGLSHSIVSLIERDLHNPTLSTLLRIAEAIGVDLGEIISKARRLLLLRKVRIVVRARAALVGEGAFAVYFFFLPKNPP